jgi:eukaryotic-like serine/threonine-protein kinase
MADNEVGAFPSLPETDPSDLLSTDVGDRRDLTPASETRLPETIGPFRILSLLGEGGMGSVFLAEQTDPVRRKVALKLIRSAFLGREARIRFETERQAMARLQHPNVAQIYEAGTTAEGQPYFAMEHVAGDRITVYCDENRLPIDQRLKLFCDVCAAVQHAHQKGILHRDLKPGNILVTEIEGNPAPKIIDFGVAKAVDQPLSGATMLTGTKLVGTPAYLAPEAAQLEGGSGDVDTRADVYSLGIILYELLVGRRPFDDRKENILQVLRRIAEEEAVGPSTLWGRMSIEDRTACARPRHLDETALRRRLRGDLDWIVLKAIAREPQMRYGSAAELAADVRRHLLHEPVEAGPPSALYRLRKFVRRRLGPVLAGVLLLLVLAGGVVARTQEARRANREATAAIEARRQAEEALGAAEQAREETEEVSAFLSGLFQVSDPGDAMGNAVTARELLDTGADRIRAGFADQPLARARFMQTIADVYRKLGLYDDAQELFEEALEIRRGALPPDHPDIAESLNGLAALFGQTGRLAEAEALFEEALAIREKAFEPNDLKIAMSLSNLANMYTDRGANEEAEKLYLRSVAIAREHADEATPDVLVALNNLGTLYLDQGRYQEAEPLLQEFLDYQREAHGSRHPHVAVALYNLAEVRWHLGAYKEAEKHYLSAIEILEDVLGAGHPEVAYGLTNLADLYQERGRLREAEALYRQALKAQRQALSPDHPELQDTIEGLARLLRAQGRAAEAEALEAKTLAEPVNASGSRLAESGVE